MATLYKQPVSIQVVIFSAAEAGRQYLLLKRVAHHGGFWQSLTGSLEIGESHRQAAVREVFEETGIVCTEDDLIDLGLTNVFEIAPLWRDKYAPGVTHNEETCFALAVASRLLILDPAEHESYMWVSYAVAHDLLYWKSNKQALRVAEETIMGA